MDPTPPPQPFDASLAGKSPEFSSSEDVTAIVHFYRAEMHRSTLWRMRLDTTTNWAILATTAVVTYSFSQAEHSHASLLVGMLMVLTFLSIEARRFRILAVWRERTRTLEQNFFAPIFTSDPVAAEPGWARKLASELKKPEFTMTRMQAIRVRLASNYMPLFGLLLLCWLVKVHSAAEDQPLTLARWIDGMGVGLIPGEIVGSVVAAVYVALIAIRATSREITSEEDLFHDACSPEC